MKMSVKIFLLLLNLLLIINKINAQETNEAVQFIDHPDKNEYLLHQPGSDKHKYGYELRDNKHFHHTTTEDDGVRLGCYGYVLEGKKYSTQYVADVKGYRPVYTYGVINVYPKSGDVREASFIGNFNEDERKSSNIRYFFPEGCRGSAELLSPDQNKMAPPVPLTRTPPLVPPTPTTPSPSPSPITTTKPSVTTEKRTTSLPILPPINSYQPVVPYKPSEKYLPPIASTYLPPVFTSTASPNGKYITKTNKPQVTTPKVQTTPKPSIILQTPPASPVLSTCEILGNCVSQTVKIKTSTDTCSQCCSNESSPMITIPFKFGNGKSDACSSYAKLIIPAESVSLERVKSLLRNPSEFAEYILRSLS